MVPVAATVVLGELPAFVRRTAGRIRAPSALGVNGHSYRLDELADKVEEIWFILDSAVVSVAQPGAVKSGETHQIDAVFGMRIPYIAIGPSNYLTVVNKQSATQVAA